jgi:hypothetical protein
MTKYRLVREKHTHSLNSVFCTTRELSKVKVQRNREACALLLKLGEEWTGLIGQVALSQWSQLGAGG